MIQMILKRWEIKNATNNVFLSWFFHSSVFCGDFAQVCDSRGILKRPVTLCKAAKVFSMALKLNRLWIINTRANSIQTIHVLISKLGSWISHGQIQSRDHLKWISSKSKILFVYKIKKMSKIDSWVLEDFAAKLSVG